MEKDAKEVTKKSENLPEKKGLGRLGTKKGGILLSTLDSLVTEKASESHNSLPGPDVLWWSVGVFVP